MSEINWKRNTIILCLTQLLTLIGFSSYIPIVPFYMMDLGAADYSQALKLNAAFTSGSAISMMIMSPIWGVLADRYGRKMMLVRATLGGAVMSLLMGLARTPEQLIIIRTVQGALTGTVSAAMTLIATQTPERSLGLGLGMMQTVQYAGNAVGPLVGGSVADAFGFRTVFMMSSALQVISLVLCIVLVREHFVRTEQSQGPRRTPRQALSTFAGVTGTLLFMVFLLRLTTTTASPIMSLYVQSIDPTNPRINTLAGMVSSVSAVTSAISAYAVGRLGDRLGQAKVLLISVLGMMAVYIPLAYVQSVGQLLVTYGVLGLFLGGTMPTANALLARSTPNERRGSVFGLSNSFQAAGRSVGPMVGAGVAARWSMPMVFLTTGGFCAIIAAILAVVQGKLRNSGLPASVAESAEE